MRSILFWISTALLVLGALSATVAMATMKWLYPTSAAPVGQEVQAVTPATVTPAVPVAPPKDSAGLEQAALTFIQRAAAGDANGAKALAAGLADSVFEQIRTLSPVTQQAALLPGPAGAPSSVLVWATYRRDGNTARGAYRLSFEAGKVAAVSGPLAPDKGYKALPWKPTDDRGRTVNLESYKGRGLVIVAPRLPEPDLTATLSRLHAVFAPLGVDVILAVDLGGPDMTKYVRNAGFSGAIWRIKGHLEDAPVVSKGRVLGAVGLLVDRTGTVVASLAALDPSRYNLDDQPIEAIAPAVFRAYGLVP